MKLRDLCAVVVAVILLLRVVNEVYASAPAGWWAEMRLSEQAEGGAAWVLPEDGRSTLIARSHRGYSRLVARFARVAPFAPKPRHEKAAKVMHPPGRPHLKTPLPRSATADLPFH
jgi:hypothetical protein